MILEYKFQINIQFRLIFIFIMNQIISNTDLGLSFDIISIEGNIGSGKSTLINLLKHVYTHVNNSQYHVQYHFVDEPVSEWESIVDKTNGDKNILQLFYENQEKYSFVFQITAYITRLSNLKKKIDSIVDKRRLCCLEKKSVLKERHVIITERSLQTDRHVFAQMLYDDGKINEIEWVSYNHWFDAFSKEYGTGKIIYVNVSPTVSYTRTKKRDRGGEESIPLGYLKRCFDYHEQWISTFDPCNVMTFDASVNIDVVQMTHYGYIKPVVEFIK